MKKVFTILYLLISIQIFAQKNILCDTVYNYPEVNAYFKSGNIGLPKYINTKLAPILIECQSESQLIASMNIVLTINRLGRVTAVDFPGFPGSDNCKLELKKEILKMADWTPAKIGHQNVCSKYYWTISCLKWESTN